VKFLSPRQSSENDWLGSSVSMSVTDCKEFIKLLELYQAYIHVANSAMRMRLQNTTVDALDDESLAMASPTKEMLEEAVKTQTRIANEKNASAATDGNDEHSDGTWYVLFPESPNEIDEIRKTISGLLDLSRKE
jgi:hypothetical protein